MANKLDYEYVKQEFEKIGFTLISREYKNCYSFLECMCPKGHDLKVTWNSFSQNKGCKYCSGIGLKEYSFVKQEFENHGFSLISTSYVNEKDLLDCICPKGHKIKISWNVFRSGTRCSDCSGCRKKDYQFIKDEFEKRGYFLLSDEYINSKAKLKYVCSFGHEGEISWNSFKIGSVCPKCKLSKGESIIFKILSKLEIKNNSQVKFDDCKNKQKLPFDFGIRLKENSWILIEFQGQQHYVARGEIGAKEKLVKCQKNDQLKRDFCIKMNYELIEIPYWLSENKIEELLTRSLKSNFLIR